MNFPLCSFLVCMFCILCSSCVKRENSRMDMSSLFMPGKQYQLLVTDPFNENLNQLILKELVKRTPRDKQYTFRDEPVVSPWHRMTRSLQCTIDLPKFKTKDPQEALNVFLAYAKAYADTMNNVREIRPYLKTFPFDFNSWAFSVYFAIDPKTDRYFYEPYICGVSVYGPELVIHRLYREQRLETGQLCHDVFVNAYDTPKILPEALQKLAIPHFDEKTEPIAIPEAIKYCNANDSQKEEFHFFKKFAAKNGLLLIALDQCLYRQEAHSIRNDCMQVAYASQEKVLTLKEGQDLVAKIRDAIIQFSSGYVKIKNWANLLRKQGKESLSPTINLQEYMSFRISFWDEYIDRVKAPHIAEIRVIGQKARYYIADELQRLQLVHEEELPPHTIEIPVPEELLKSNPTAQ